MPPCHSCGRRFQVEEGGLCRACIALRRFSPHCLLESQITTQVIESALRSLEILRDLCHAAADRGEIGEGPVPGLRSIRDSNSRSERPEVPPARTPPVCPPPPPKKPEGESSQGEPVERGREKARKRRREEEDDGDRDRRRRRGWFEQKRWATVHWEVPD